MAKIIKAFSPRKWRCFRDVHDVCLCLRVFSAQAEVFLRHATNWPVLLGFLRASGGVSTIAGRRIAELLFSPRKRRCFSRRRRCRKRYLVFSAHAEVFR